MAIAIIIKRIFSYIIIILYTNKSSYFNKIEKLKWQLIILRFYSKYLIILIFAIFLVSLICYFFKKHKKSLL